MRVRAHVVIRAHVPVITARVRDATNATFDADGFSLVIINAFSCVFHLRAFCLTVEKATNVPETAAD